MSQLLPIFCPACDRQRIDSLMRKTAHQPREGMMVACTVANHSYAYDRLMALKPRMQKAAFNEKQPGNTQIQQFWIYPEALAALRERWPSNLMTTICSFLTALADGSSFVVEGEYARELAAANPPITKGRDVAGLLHTIEQLRIQIVNLEEQVKASKRSSATSPATSDPRLDAIMAALSKSGIEVPILVATTQPAQPAQPDIELGRDPYDVDFHEGDPDPNWTGQPAAEPVEPTYRGLPRPTPGPIR